LIKIVLINRDETFIFGLVWLECVSTKQNHNFFFFLHNRLAMQIYFLILLQLVSSQTPPVTPPVVPGTPPVVPAPAPAGTLANDGSLQDRGQRCTQASEKMRNDYINCYPNFPATAKTMEEADAGAFKFVTCVCASSWRAGTIEQLQSSIPICPAIPGTSKGQQAAVAADCAPGQSIAQQRRIIQSFDLTTVVGGKDYQPLAGFPPGVKASSSVSHSLSYTMIVLFLMYLAIK
jgi:hypothetical protein